ncbi:MAG: ANTAR domain-containing protein [Clostridia bacterium]|nr:ANTAR domain-containing protein [Clostridia bacterium]
MARILVASNNQAVREQLSRLLASSGFQIFRLCASGSELRRALNDCEDAVVILAGNLSDLKADELQWDWGERAQILLIGKPDVLEACESEEVFRLALPSSGQAIAGAVGMLSQLHRMRLPKRTADDKSIVEQAKRLIMEKQKLSEAEAHRLLQQYAMNHGMKMADYASRILRSEGKDE